jgi:3-hydroxyisobutyrate dehydrogenase
MGTARQFKKIGWIGTGIMGGAMASHIIKRGYSLIVHNRTRQKATPLMELGAEWAESPAALAEQADVVCIMVSFPKDVEEVVLGKNGVLTTLERGKLMIDFTTSSPSLAKRIYMKAKEKGIHSLDAPVSGGDIGAKNATLSIMVGGDDAAFKKALPLLKVLGKTIVHQGAAGAGQHAKMVNQILLAGTMMGLCEALIYADLSGLNSKKVLESVQQGAAASWSLSNLAPRILAGDFKPGFMVEHFAKDLGIALYEAKLMKMELTSLMLAEKLYSVLTSKDFGKFGIQALILLIAMINDKATKC